MNFDFNFTDFSTFIDNLQNTIWTYGVLSMLVILAAYFSFALKLLPHRISLSNLKKSSLNKSSLGALLLATAARVGTGNIAGVAVALHLGGAGAIFWMWVISFFSATLAFLEAVMAQLYKNKNSDGNFFGGAAFYILKGTNIPILAICYAITMIIYNGFGNSMLQGQTIISAFNNSFAISPLLMGIVLAILSGIIIFGGIKNIVKLSFFLAPPMIIIYFAMSAFFVIKNFDLFPLVISKILSSAISLNPQEIFSGAVAAAILNGIKRGLFSNEAGEGSATHAAAIANVSHPVNQGILQLVGVFLDTWIVCSCTAFLILFSGVDYQNLNGVIAVQTALENDFGKVGNYFLSVMIFLFAFTTLIANYYYSEINLLFLLKQKNVSSNITKNCVHFYRLLILCCVTISGLVSIDFVWSYVDLAMAFSVFINLIALYYLFPQAKWLLKDYIKQMKSGIAEPIFDKSKFLQDYKNNKMKLSNIDKNLHLESWK